MAEKIVLVVMDGVGFSKTGLGDAVSLANTPTLDRLLKECPNTRLKAHGTAVGLPSDDDMGNSEVGHNALGCGQIYSQGAKLVNESIESGKIYSSAAWGELVGNCKSKNSTLHFIGLLSDGNVHSNILLYIIHLRKRLYLLNTCASLSVIIIMSINVFPEFSFLIKPSRCLILLLFFAISN